MTGDTLDIVRLWAAAAWADGKLHPTERAAIERLIAASDELDVEARRAALRMIEAPPTVDVAEVRKLDAAAREGVYRAALGIVRLDRQVTDDERAFLTRLRAVLDLDEATLTRIEKESR